MDSHFFLVVAKMYYYFTKLCFLQQNLCLYFLLFKHYFWSIILLKGLDFNFMVFQLFILRFAHLLIIIMEHPKLLCLTYLFAHVQFVTIIVLATLLEVLFLVYLQDVSFYSNEDLFQPFFHPVYFCQSWVSFMVVMAFLELLSIQLIHFHLIFFLHLEFVNYRFSYLNFNLAIDHLNLSDLFERVFQAQNCFSGQIFFLLYFL